MKDKQVKDFYKEDVPSYASGDNVRKIASYIDGLKLSARKLVYTMIEKYPNPNVKTKTAQFANVAAAFTNYNQGENNLGGVTNTLAQDFCGANNYPLFLGKGNFGNRLDDLCAATRYTFVSPSKILKALFNDNDKAIVGNQVYEGDKIEPLFYVPIVSTLFLNGSNGISTGFRQVVLPRNLDDIIEYIKKKLNGTEHPRMQLLPYWKNFKGSSRYNAEGGLEILGCVEMVNMTSYKITELPITTSYVSYCKFLDKLEEDGTIQSWKDLCDPKTNELLFEVKTTREFTRKHNDAESLLKVFHLIKPFTECYNCIDENNRVREFKSITDILDAFIDIRLKFYDKRKTYMLTTFKEKLSVLASKYLFVKGIVDKTIIVSNKKKDDIVKQLEKNAKIIKVNDSYDYLLSMAIHSLTKEKLEELKKQIEDGKAEYAKVKATSINDMWIEDLSALKKEMK